MMPTALSEKLMPATGYVAGQLIERIERVLDKTPRLSKSALIAEGIEKEVERREKELGLPPLA